MTKKQTNTPHGWLEDATQYSHPGPCDPETCVSRHMIGCVRCTRETPCDQAPEYTAKPAAKRQGKVVR